MSFFLHDKDYFRTMSVYQYVPLPDNQSIRIFILYPGVEDAPVIGSLQFVNIDRAGSYEPVSYAWGDSMRTHSVMCSGAELILTTSLHDALRRFRLPDRPRRLWVDQLCINQDDVHERSQQVQFMNAIYRNASHVLVWLGQDSDAVAQSAFELVHKLDGTFDDNELQVKFHLNHTEGLANCLKEDWEPMKLITMLPWVSTSPEAYLHPI